MLRPVAAVTVALAMAATGCSKKGAPEQVADAFADAYFRRMDQEKAKEYTALGATEMLDEELRQVTKIRKEGYTPSDASQPEISVRRGTVTPRDQRLRFPFEVIVRPPGGAESVREADVELTQIDGKWKVVRVGVKPRP